MVKERSQTVTELDSGSSIMILHHRLLLNLDALSASYRNGFVYCCAAHFSGNLEIEDLTVLNSGQSSYGVDTKYFLFSDGHELCYKAE
jgi:hypothetical protein